MVRADLGLAPWDVLHQGVADHTGISIGMVTVATGGAVLLLWLPLRERPGLGTILNVIVIGLVVDATLAVVDAPGTLWQRITFLAVGIFAFGPGSGFYIGAGLGPGPRDGLMTGLARRGRSVRVVRTAIELGALAIGASLGGTVGIGTLVFALTVGPNVHWHLERMTLPAPRSRGLSQLSEVLAQVTDEVGDEAALRPAPATRDPLEAVDVAARHDRLER
ncbi:MAG: YczE/YyaS/YitT family protein [Actinomycetota bacterium]